MSLPVTRALKGKRERFPALSASPFPFLDLGSLSYFSETQNWKRLPKSHSKILRYLEHLKPTFNSMSKMLSLLEDQC